MKPFLPGEIEAKPHPLLRTLARAVIARGITKDADQAVQHARKTWGGDRDTLDLLTKGAVTPTATTTANAPISTLVKTLPNILGKASAMGAILNLAGPNVLDFDGANALSVVDFKPQGTTVAFSTQNGGFPVFQLSASGVMLYSDRKSGGIAAVTRQLFEHSSAETLLPVVLAKNLGFGFDALLFDNVAASTTRPAGLKNGIAAITADGGSGETAMANDLANLAGAVAPISATNIAFICSPEQYVKLMLRKPSDFAFPVLCSSALADGQVACLGLDAIAFAGDGEPTFTISRQATVAMRDDPPATLSTVGTPNTIAAPILSAFQSDLVMLKFVANLDWALRDASGFAWTQNVNW